MSEELRRHFERISQELCVISNHSQTAETELGELLSQVAELRAARNVLLEQAATSAPWLQVNEAAMVQHMGRLRWVQEAIVHHETAIQGKLLLLELIWAEQNSTMAEMNALNKLFDDAIYTGQNKHD